MSAAPPLFSVIIPLEYHRGQWEQCLRQWQAQTLADDEYEIIVVVPPDFAQGMLPKLTKLLGAQARIERSTASHDIALAAIGAAKAQGKFLFFTEAHCWPEADVLEKCVRKFAAEPDLAGFSCRSMRITHNRLSEAEADMYDADIEHGMNIHPWLKILDQCFVTHRTCYEQCGGFKPDLGHFSEWVLAASYYSRGYKIGYEPDARFYHYYIGSLGDLKTFTRDFAAGEIRFFERYRGEAYGHLFEPPAEWWCRGNFDRGLARSMLRITWHLARHAKVRVQWRVLARWLIPAAVGGAGARAGARLKRLSAFARLVRSRSFYSRPQLGATFKAYIEALIHESRLTCIASIAADSSQRSSERSVSEWNIFAADHAGFYPSELFEQVRFRWSETEAVMYAWVPAGSHRIRIECAPVRSLRKGLGVQFFFNEQPIPDTNISIERWSIDVKVDAPQAGVARLAWVCLPFAAAADNRRLGLPIQNIALNGAVGSEESNLDAKTYERPLQVV